MLPLSDKLNVVRGHRDPQAPAVCKRRRDKPVAGIVSSSLVGLGSRLVPQRLAENAYCGAQLRRPIARGDCPAPGALRSPSRTLSATGDKPQGSLFAGASNRCGTVAAAASLRLYSNTYTGSASHVPRLVVSARIVSPAKPEAPQQHFSIAPRHQVRTAWCFHFCSESVFAGFGTAV